MEIYIIIHVKLGRLDTIPGSCQVALRLYDVCTLKLLASPVASLLDQTHFLVEDLLCPPCCSSQEKVLPILPNQKGKQKISS